MCPHCKQLQPGLVTKDGRVLAGMNIVLSYQCINCGHLVHCGFRAGRKKESV